MADRVGRSLGNYQLIRLLGSGAFAEVYLAEHRYLEVPAAIKVLHVRMGPDTQEQFLREARTIAHLQHPHIMRVHDFGFQDETPYLVMEYSPNGTLRERHPKGTRLSLEQIIHYVKQIAPALDYAHQQRVIHRDIKPENLLLNANDEVVLSDFGVAVVQQSRDSLLTQNQAGTPIYMAPEQIQGKPSAASDQYALGVLVYEWLCGEPPFRGTLFEVLSQHLHETPVSLCARVPSLPFAVEDAVFGALAKEPHARFVSVQDFADVLEEVHDATQPLGGSLSSPSASPEPLSPPDTAPLPVHASSPAQPDHPASRTQTLVLTRRQTADREEPQAAWLQLRGTPRSRTNRQRLLHKVRTYWIAGVLERSLYGNALVALGLEEQPDAVANPWQLVLHHPTSTPRPLPMGTRINEVYDAADGELLILGAPGSGKTTLLLELTRDLLDRAELDEQHPMPVVFNLASWAIKQMPLADWLVEELNSTYQVPHKLGQVLVEADQILPLLDGLDEVAPKVRTACIETINSYRQEHGLLPLVVCSRSADYLAQEARVQLGSAVAVQPLTQQQVDGFLARGGEPLQALRLALRKDAALRELTSTPLMLSILTLTYHGMPVEELLSGASLTERQQQVFARYVERMLRRRGAEMRYTPEQTTRWLSWLARQLKQQNQTVFYLEQMQPDWLSGNRGRRVYDWVAVRLPGVLMGVLFCFAVYVFILGIFHSISFGYPSLNDIFGGIFRNIFGLPMFPFFILFGLLGGLLSEGGTTHRLPVSSGKSRRAFWPRLLQWLLIGSLIGLGIGLTTGLGSYRQYFSYYYPGSPSLYDVLGNWLKFGLSFGVCSTLLQFLLGKNNTTERRSRTPPPGRGTIWLHFLRRRAVRIGLPVGLITGLLVGLGINLSYDLTAGVEIGLGTGLSAGVLSVLLYGRSAAVQPTDLLVWSWRSLRKSLFSKSHVAATAQVIVLSGLGIGLNYGWVGNGGSGFDLNFVLIYGSIYGLSLGLGYWLLFGLLQGVSGVSIEDQRRVVPNQGIRSSALNGLVLGLICVAIVGLLYMLSSVLSVVIMPYNPTGLFVSNILNSLNSWLDSGARAELPAAVLVGLSAGLLVGLLNGVLPSFRHYVLRFLLWRAGWMPWNYVRFLDDAAGRILLRKVGGGYIFVHRLLLDYFASLESGETFKPLISRRVLLTGLAGTGVAAAGGGLTWWLLTPHPLYTYHGHSSAVGSLAWSPDGTRIVSVSYPYLYQSQERSDVQVWDALNGEHAYTYPKDVGIVYGAAWSPDGKSLAFASSNGVEVWNAAVPGTHRFTHKVSNHQFPAFAWSPDGKSIASSSGASVEVWDAITQTHRFTLTTQSPIYALAWSPDGQRIASLSRVSVEVWDATKAREHALVTHKGYIYSSLPYAPAWSPDSKYIVSAGQDTTVQVWDATTGIHRFTYTGHSQAVTAVAWSPHGDRIASASMDGTIQVWSAFDGSRVSTYRDMSSLSTLLSGADPMYTVAWSPDGTRIASGDRAGLVQIWSVV